MLPRVRLARRAQEPAVRAGDVVCGEIFDAALRWLVAEVVCIYGVARRRRVDRQGDVVIITGRGLLQGVAPTPYPAVELADFEGWLLGEGCRWLAPACSQ